MSEHPLIYIDMVKNEPLTISDFGASTISRLYRRTPADPDAEYREYLDEFQPWRWIAKSGDNHETLAVSSEAYFNESDAKHAVDLLFGPRSNVYRRQHEVGNKELRLANWTKVPEQ